MTIYFNRTFTLLKTYNNAMMDITSVLFDHVIMTNNCNITYVAMQEISVILWKTKTASYVP